LLARQRARAVLYDVNGRLDRLANEIQTEPLAVNLPTTHANRSTLED